MYLAFGGGGSETVTRAVAEKPAGAPRRSDAPTGESETWSRRGARTPRRGILLADARRDRLERWEWRRRLVHRGDAPERLHLGVGQVDERLPGRRLAIGAASPRGVGRVDNPLVERHVRGAE